jgi:hypothetical protein
MKIYVVGSSKNDFLSLNNIREKFLIDKKHTGDNIDFLNPWYCELTGLYYLWKHCDDDIVGLEHYRRYFVNKNNKLLTKTEIENILQNNDVICKKYYFKSGNKGFGTFKVNGWLNGFWNYLSKIEDVNFVKFLLEYLKKDYFIQCNMFICKKEIIDKYCDFLFNTLSELKVSDFYYTKRICGYYAEFTFGAWLLYNNYKIYYNKVRQI